MQTQVFKIDESQVGKIAKRNFLRAVKILLPIFAVVSVYQYFQYKSRHDELIGLYIGMSLFFPLFMLLPIYLGAKKATKSIRTLELILNDNGVEKKAEMAPYRQIAWQNVALKEKPNGTLDIYDKNVSAFMRWWNGTGRIILPPEMLNRETLITELQKHAGRYNG